MQLTKIRLYGFKSFADKTEFDFGEGVTIVVGPNGCGKSNIVDAVRWVLGEQSAKSLRGGQMLDVIFNGTNNRKSMSYAEVTLVFANTHGMLHIETEEVSVTRKLYRSGESQYLLNNKQCRLKDIRELFMDTGIGADAYSIIEQGKVEVLLQASKEDRRSIFEEAAGISKYKSRKKEALRKLDRTEQNMLRLSDIISELEKQLRSIRYQAGKARSYQTHTTRLRELRLNWFLAEYYQQQNENKAKQGYYTRKQDELLALTTALEKAQTQLSLLDDELDGTDRQMRQAESQLLQCTSQIGSQEDRIEYGHRRSEELKQIIVNHRRQLQSLRDQVRILQEEYESDQEQIRQSESLLAEQQEKLGQLQNVRQELGLELAEYRAQMEDEKSGLIDIVRRTAQLHNEINSLDVRRTSLSGQRDRLHDRCGQIRGEMKELLTVKAQVGDKLSRIRELLQESQNQLEATRQQTLDLDHQRQECSENLSSAKEYRSGLLSRQQLLEDLEAKLEGVDVGVKQILQAKSEDSDNFYYIKGMVAQLLQADVKYAAIVEAALSHTAQHLVATSSQSILEDSETLENLRGRVQILSLDRLPPFRNGYDFSQHPEVKAKLIDLVSYSNDCERLAWHLLGKTILVDTIDSAMRLAQVAPAGYRWVTLSGELLEADGALHIGPPTGSAGLISRKSELRQLTESLTEADERIRELQHQTEQYSNQAQHLEKNLQEMRTAIYENRTEEVETRSQLEQIQQNVDRLKQEEPLIATEIESLEHQIQEAHTLQATSQQDLSDLESVNQQRQDEVDRLEQKIAQLEERDRQTLDQITEVKVCLGQTQQKRLALKETLEKTQIQRQHVQHTIKTLETDLHNEEESLTTTERSILEAETTLTELFQTRQSRQEQSRSLRQQFEQLQADKQQLTEQTHELGGQKEQLQEHLHEVQMELNEIRLRSENLMERAREELELDLVERFDTYEHEEIDWDAVSAEIEELKRKIERLGNINLDAIAEQEELEERANNLNQQLTDLNDAKRQLEQLIEKINRESEELFRVNFEAICANFEELFRKLFGGGRAEVILEDPDNILECGIEIIARPPGKQLQSISLLSGGEKTMTAVALLMAIFKSKPSPFCLLDEVDAALDEANIERFNLVVQEFLQDSQFVIVTHSRRTMSIADVIYGITMQEQGVSKKVSVRFAGEEESVPTDTAVA